MVGGIKLDDVIQQRADDVLLNGTSNNLEQ